MSLVKSVGFGHEGAVLMHRKWRSRGSNQCPHGCQHGQAVALLLCCNASPHFFFPVGSQALGALRDAVFSRDSVGQLVILMVLFSHSPIPLPLACCSVHSPDVSITVYFTWKKITWFCVSCTSWLTLFTSSFIYKKFIAPYWSIFIMATLRFLLDTF